MSCVKMADFIKYLLSPSLSEEEVEYVINPTYLTEIYRV